MPVASSPRSVPPLRILLVEDETEVAVFIQTTLQSARSPLFQLQTAPTLCKATEQLGQQCFDLVLLDLSLPDSLGLDTVRAIRSAAPDTAIVVLTASTDENTAHLMLRSGAQDFLSKSEVTPQVLRRSILYSLERKRGEKELQASRRQFEKLQQHQDNIMRALPVAVASFNVNWTVSWANRPMEKWLLQTADGRRNTLRELFANETAHRAFLSVIRSETAGSGTQLRRDVRLCAADGALRWYDVTVVCLDPSQTGAGYLVTLQDVTERRRAEDQREALRGLGQRFAGAATGKEVGHIVADESRNLFNHDAFWFVRVQEALPGPGEVQYLRIEDTPVEAAEPLSLECSSDEQWPSLPPLLSAARPLLAGAPDEKEIRTRFHEHMGAVWSRCAPVRPAMAGGSGSPAAFTFDHRPYQSVLFTPVYSDNKPVGGIAVLSRAAGCYTEEDLELLEAFSAQCGSVLARLQAEDELRHSEALHRGIVEDHSGFILRLTPDLIIQYANRALCEHLALEWEEMVGRPYLGFVPEEERNQVERHLYSSQGGVAPEPLEYSMTGAGDATCRAVWAARAVMDDGGCLRCLQLVGSDVTLLRSAESALARSERRLELVIGQIPALLWTTDRELCFTSVLGRGPGTIGDKARQPSDLVGSKITDLFRRAGRDAQALQAHTRALHERASGEFATTWAGRHYQARVEPLQRSDGTVAGVVGIAVDITDRLAEEESRRHLESELHAAEKMAAIGQAMAGIGHCMKNMLTGLKGGVFLMERCLMDSDDHRLRESHHLLSRSTSRINLLLLNMLDLAKGRSAGAQAAPVAGLLEETVAVLRAGVAALPQDHTVEIEAEAAPQVRTFRVDSERLYRALMNLGLNALDAMPHGGHVHIHACEWSPAEVEHFLNDGACPDPGWAFKAHRYGPIRPLRHLRVEVRDTGTGIEPEHLEQLFNLFFSTKASKGTGLGLATVRQFVSDHGGHLHVRSALGQGTVFTLLLPEQEEVRDEGAA